MFPIIKQAIANIPAKIPMFFLGKAYVSGHPIKYAIIPHKLRYQAICSRLMFVSLRYDRKKNLSIEINMLHKNVMLIKLIKFFLFIVVLFL